MLDWEDLYDLDVESKVALLHHARHRVAVEEYVRVRDAYLDGVRRTFYSGEYRYVPGVDLSLLSQRNDLCRHNAFRCTGDLWSYLPLLDSSAARQEFCFFRGTLMKRLILSSQGTIIEYNNEVDFTDFTSTLDWAVSFAVEGYALEHERVRSDPVVVCVAAGYESKFGFAGENVFRLSFEDSAQIPVKIFRVESKSSNTAQSPSLGLRK